MPLRIRRYHAVTIAVLIYGVFALIITWSEVTGNHLNLLKLKTIGDFAALGMTGCRVISETIIAVYSESWYRRA